MAVDTKLEDAGSSIEQTTTGLFNSVGIKARQVFDAILPPEQRAQWGQTLKQFATNHPKLAAFLLTNIVLSGGPLLLFAVFTITVFIVSLVGALIIALIAALLFTVFMLLVALFIVLPTVFLTTMAATFIFIWGLGGYYILKWFNEGKSPAEIGNAIGDRLNSLTGGRLTSVMGNLRDPAAAAGDSKEVQEKSQVLNGAKEPQNGDQSGHGNGNGVSQSPISKTTNKVGPPKLATANGTKTSS